jgi:hypoxanthine phosphoribosyltransferase
MHRPILTREQIRARVAELAEQIDRDYAGLDPILVAVLRGSVFFVADLLRVLRVPLAVDFMAVSGYAGAPTETGTVRILKDLELSIEGHHVLVIEDIIDTGLTLRFLLRNLNRRRPSSLRVCTLFNKPAHRLADLPLDYVGFDLPNEFVIGYGLDYQQRFRNLEYLTFVHD